MFFVFGMPRSGTTLLAQCLNAHPDLVLPHETDFIIPMAFLFDRIHARERGRSMVADLIVHSQGFAGSLGEYLTPDEVREAVHEGEHHPARLLERLYARVARAAGARLAGDKSPNDLNFLRMLDKTGGLAPEFPVIHLVRDVRDAMASLQRTGWLPAAADYFPRFWCSHNLYLHALRKHDPSRYLLVRYEDLVADPARELGRACDLLGVPFDEAMLAPGRRHPRYQGQAVHARLYDPISNDSVGAYRRTLDDEVQAACLAQAREGLAAFGYLDPTGS